MSDENEDCGEVSEKDLETAIRMSIESSLSESENQCVSKFQDITGCDFNVSHEKTSNNDFDLESSILTFFLENPLVSVRGVHEKLNSGFYGIRKNEVLLDVNERNKVFSSDGELKRLKDFIAREDDEFEISHLLLHNARLGNEDVVEILLSSSISDRVLEKDDLGRHFGHFAVLGCHYNLLKSLGPIEGRLNKYWLEKDEEDVSVLRIALWRGCIKSVKTIFDILEIATNTPEKVLEPEVVKLMKSFFFEQISDNVPSILWWAVFQDIANGGCEFTKLVGRNRYTNLHLEHPIFSIRKLVVMNKREDILSGLCVTGHDIFPPRGISMKCSFCNLLVGQWSRNCRSCEVCFVSKYCSFTCREQDTESHNINCHFRLGYDYFQLGKFNKNNNSFWRAIHHLTLTKKFLLEEIRKKTIDKGPLPDFGPLLGSLEMRAISSTFVGKYDNALVDFNTFLGYKWLHKDSKHSMYFNRGLCYQEMENHEMAVKDFNQAIEINSSNFDYYFNRSLSFLLLKDVDGCIKDLKKCILLNPEDVKAPIRLGRVLMEKVKDYGSAIGFFDIALKILKKMTNLLGTPTNNITVPELRKNMTLVYYFIAKCNFLLKEYEKAKTWLFAGLSLKPYQNLIIVFSELVCQVFSRLGDYNSTVLFVRKAQRHRGVNLTPGLPLVRNFIDSDHERLAEELEVNNHSPSFKPNSEKVIEIIERMDKNPDPDRWYCFLEDLRTNKEVSEEILQIQKLRSRARELVEKGKDISEIENFQVVRNIGSGTYGKTKLCLVGGVNSLYIMKEMKDKEVFPSDEARDLMVKRDSLELSFHRNVVSIIYSDISRGIILMKYHRKTLLNYLKQRKKWNQPLNDFEISLILCGVIHGADHLHKHRIVHRDLHLENIFVDEVYGRIWIGDFGCILDRRNHPMGFKVSKKEDVLRWYSFGPGEKGGCREFLPPEIVDFDDEGSEEYLDYSKSDIFSVGVVGYNLVDFFLYGKGQSVSAPFGFQTLEPDFEPVVENREQGKFVSLLGRCCEELSIFIGRMLILDPRKRIGFEEAKIEIGKIVENLRKEIPREFDTQKVILMNFGGESRLVL